MTVAEDVTIAFIILVGLVTTVPLYLGLMGMLGAGYLVRCAACGHVTWSVTAGPNS